MVERIVMRSNVNYSKKFDKKEHKEAEQELESNVSEMTDEVTKMGKVSVDSGKTLNLREAPSTDSNIVKTLKNDEMVEIMNTENGWHQVSTETGTIGHVMEQYVKTL